MPRGAIVGFRLGVHCSREDRSERGLEEGGERGRWAFNALRPLSPGLSGYLCIDSSLYNYLFIYIHFVNFEELVFLYNMMAFIYNYQDEETNDRWNVTVDVRPRGARHIYFEITSFGIESSTGQLFGSRPPRGALALCPCTWSRAPYGVRPKLARQNSF